MEKTYYYVGDLNKDELLEELWNNSNNYYNRLNHSFDLKVAKKAMKNNYPDYVCGRPIKVDIYNEDYVDYYLYDRDNYDGAFFEVINKIKKINKDFIEKANYLTNDKKVIIEASQLYNDYFNI